MDYSVLQTLHLLAAIMFIGTVFFEVVIIEGIRFKVQRESIREVELAIGQRARKIMPWIILLLFASGITMVAMHYSKAVADPLASSFGTLLTLKIILAGSVFCHFCTAMFMLLTGRMTSTLFRRLHISVFCHMLAIVVLAKGMFYFTW